MRTSEFKKKVEELGFDIDRNMDGGFNIDSEDDTVACLSRDARYNIDTDWIEFAKLKENKQNELFLILTEYASTPISEREEEKRYRLKLSLGVELKDGNILYLNMLEDSKVFFLSGRIPTKSIKTIFTESELKTMDLTGFEKVEVTEWTSTSRN